MSDLSNYWPKSMDHLRHAYDNGVSEHVVIAETSEAPCNGYTGLHTITTALVPLKKLKSVLSAQGDIGSKVESWGPHPVVDKGTSYNTHFWIEGRAGRDEKFQTIVNSWTHHDREVHLPDNVMLMTYGLVPRHLADGTICWDDPQGPVFEVLRVKPYIDHSRKDVPAFSQIIMRRDYLEDYCSLKRCAAVAVYFEERYSSDDQTFEQMLAGRREAEFMLPGRRLWLKLLGGSDDSAAPQYCCVWGSRLILIPTQRQISEAKDPILVWPGDTKPMSKERASREWVYAYTSDEVLCEYESRDEYQIYPEYGGVSYGGWWGTDRTYRFGRHHIRVELKKLYEGCPPHVIAHWHRFAVPEAVAEHDRKTHGDRNIATRAKELILAYLRLTKSLETLSEALAAGFSQKDIGALAADEVEYSGWWAVPVMKPIAAVVPLSASKDQFLGRAMAIYKLLENLKQAPIRNLILKLGIQKEKVKDTASLKLLATLCQLAAIANEHGLSLVEEAPLVVEKWDPEAKLQALKSVFALNELRICAAHTPGREKDQKISKATKQFGIDVTANASGWGSAIDSLYDQLGPDLDSLAVLLESASCCACA